MESGITANTSVQI
jgi:hypothetical protein